MPARLINIKYITIRAEKVASPVTALHILSPLELDHRFSQIRCLPSAFDALKLGTHYPCPRPVDTGVQNDVSTDRVGRVHGPWTRVLCVPNFSWSRLETSAVHFCQRRAIESAPVHGVMMYICVPSAKHW